MIRMPRRSVTRFFIPMIDVLTLLFCMFLLMPIIRENESYSQLDEFGENKSPDELRVELRKLYQEQDRVKTTLAELERKQKQFRQQMPYIKVIEISPADGSLSYFDTARPGQPPLKIADADVARELIGKHRKEAGLLKLVYLFTRPYDAAYPNTLQPDQVLMNRYRQWFDGVECTGLVTTRPAGEKGAPP
ncbi:MAG TPA: hypothetical protein VE988_22515 [Gemmataceae bacterium]|nr:hypothetical protein [Gemmataceae bacterium]